MSGGYSSEETTKWMGGFGKPAQPFDEDATAFTYHLIYDETIYVEYDVQKLDQYGRHLVYVYLDDGTFLNEVILKKSWAEVMTIPPNVKHAELFRKAYREARENHRGMWSGQANN